jgi:hypothetical protein
METTSLDNNKEIRKVSNSIGEYSQPCTTTSANSLQFAHSSNTNEWRTPVRYVDVLREVFEGRIELDPASSTKGNEVVGAERYYTISDDGLAQPWNADTLFLNPPYGKLIGKSHAGVWAQRLISEYTSGNVRQAILLVTACTSERWFQPLFQYPLCFTNHRIPFNGVDGKGKAPTKGSAFVYFGTNPERFASIFSAHNIGTVVSRHPVLNRIDDNPKPCFPLLSEEFRAGEEEAGSE